MFKWFKRKQSGINFDVCIGNLFTFSDSYIAKERVKAQPAFFGQSFPYYAKSKSETEKAMARMLEWFVFDRQLPKYKKTPAELFIETNQDRWDEATRKVYADLLDNIYSFFEIMEVRIGEALTLRNLADDRRYVVKERKATYEVQPGWCLSGRIFPFEGAYLLSGVMDLWPGEAADWLKREFRKLTRNKGGTPIRPPDVERYIHRSDKSVGDEEDVEDPD